MLPSSRPLRLPIRRRGLYAGENRWHWNSLWVFTNVCATVGWRTIWLCPPHSNRKTIHTHQVCSIQSPSRILFNARWPRWSPRVASAQWTRRLAHTHAAVKRMNANPTILEPSWPRRLGESVFTAFSFRSITFMMPFVNIVVHILNYDQLIKTKDSFFIFKIDIIWGFLFFLSFWIYFETFAKL